MGLKTYTAMLTYGIRNRDGVIWASGKKTVRDIRAADIIEASNMALAKAPDYAIAPSISSIWYDWPQPAMH